MSEDSLRLVTVERTGTGHFTATNARGGTIDFGTGTGTGTGDGTEFTPVELLLAAIGGCTAADVDASTSRHTEPTAFTVTVSGHKVSDEDGNRMTDLAVSFHVTFPAGAQGDRSRAILPRAVAVSHERLCTVSRTVEAGTPVAVSVDDVSAKDLPAEDA
ncbi:OsmC family protein [Streptomyces sp. NPDC007901]|uniref:OsmC family protein n=1 Tax=Streptomyces sp. NPDC007901 TaxID=3364785 RepID=UPI0036EEA6C9